MVILLVGPNILNKSFYLVYLISLVLGFYDHMVKLKLNKVLFI